MEDASHLVLLTPRACFDYAVAPIASPDRGWGGGEGQYHLVRCGLGRQPGKF